MSIDTNTQEDDVDADFEEIMTPKIEAPTEILGWERITDDADPQRCQGYTAQRHNGAGGGQCFYKAIAPGKYCQRHGGHLTAAKNKQEKVRNYNLTKWRIRVNQFADNPEIKSLREEIGIIRMMIETVLEMCKDESDLLLWAGKLQTLIFQAQKLVESCHKLEERTGVLLDKASILVFCDSAVKIIANFVEDGDALDTIATQLVDVVAKIGGLNDVLNNVAGSSGAY